MGTTSTKTDALVAWIGRLPAWIFAAGSLPVLVGMSILMGQLAALIGVPDDYVNPMEAHIGRGVLLPAFFALVVAPLEETLLFQLCTKRILGKLGYPSLYVYLVVSAALFTLSHEPHPLHGMNVFGQGLLLALGFAARDYPGGHPFLLTAAAHSLRNALSTTLIYLYPL